MTFDTKVPSNLLNTQKWFGSVISQEINADSLINPIAPSGKTIKEEALQFIAPSPTLEPYRRIELYHQQYWWRLLNTMQEAFPLTLRLFGYYDFNEKIAKPYLLAYPPRHWSLNPLGDRLTEWVEKHYKASDKALVLNAVKLDYIYIDSFVAEELPPITPGDQASLTEKPLVLQPHIQPLNMPYDLVSFRRAMLKESVEHWVKNPFPTLSKKKRFYFVLARSKTNDIGWHEITLPEFMLLERLKKPHTLMELCEWLENQKREVVNIASQNLQKWFQEWTSRGWISQSNANNAAS
jgi:hypothetical protein